MLISIPEAMPRALIHDTFSVYPIEDSAVSMHPSHISVLATKTPPHLVHFCYRGYSWLGAQSFPSVLPGQISDLASIKLAHVSVSQ